MVISIELSLVSPTGQQLSTMGQTEHPGRHSPATEFKALCSSRSPSCGHLSLAESQKLVTVCWRTTKLIVQGVWTVHVNMTSPVRAFQETRWTLQGFLRFLLEISRTSLLLQSIGQTTLNKDQLLPLDFGYFTLSIPRILKGTMGGTLVMECRYNVGEEGHRKFWCRGPNWTDCVRVIETEQMAGQEAQRQYQ
ncbi:uncharacterized protein LOC102963130 isoform X3 [Panthera tigris]|uniref:uncharacterized protein LOC102963130 isoform X3 n=1 Tax=Panthera tigris TaxID=9694 RepID=UPI001C6F8988|nr:uncharacterized protein LOC102963130 isoform X3 [Panthera tigris]